MNTDAGEEVTEPDWAGLFWSMVEGAHKLPHEVARLTGTQLLALSRAANKEKEAVQIISEDGYLAASRAFAAQESREVILEKAKQMLAEED